MSTNEQLIRMFQEHDEKDDKRAEEHERRFSSNDRRFMEIQSTLNEILKTQKQMADAMKPLIEAYDGVLFGKKVITGTAAIVVAVASIGGALIWFLDFVRK